MAPSVSAAPAINQVLGDLIKRVAAAHDLPWALVQAVVMTESSGNTWAYRYEPHYRYLVGSDLAVTEQVGQQTSWGLMQVMGAVARELGFTGWFPALCAPETGLLYGCKHLRRAYDRYQHWQNAISTYNQGSPRKTYDGQYANQPYVDVVLRYWDALDNSVPLKESEA